ncbi:Bifunctional inhibitor/lipid-transfer protein/seed storage 2S albumin superfamily protein [Prunus dulcis]|uniref:Bifunctional inhibitor/lipid-transfer protein/seed storage 2S albumin superfamily protein n=1 Tax=Prunus dulcis TaxID=3755 RepID=A0A4Y1RF13_PRUDU|nr:Bifunctional inhibitor/lipid-transfer protein/seed storage 2S albumin superfamily protein [Prunus dulcis]
MNASETGVVPAEGSPMPKSATSGNFDRVTVKVRKEVKVGGLHKVPMWDFVQVVAVATRVLGIRFGSWELRQVSGTSEVCLPSAGEKAWLPWC